MAPRFSSRRLLTPLFYASGFGAVGGIAMYISYRPRNIPGSEPAAVPPPTVMEGGVLIPPKFPTIKSREAQIADLKRSSGATKDAVSQLVASKRSSGAPKDSRADDDIYDLLVIGSGATGSGIALDAVTRGLKVALVDRDDFASGTSSKSTKLVHGGVRYLEKAVWNLDYSQYQLVREALRERKYFLDTAPHLSSWLPIMLPLQKWYQAPYFWAGTKFYDWLAGSEGIESSYFLTRSKALDAFPMLKKENLVGALVYYDGQHNDSRMNVSLAMTAALYGATVVNHLNVTGLEKDASQKLCGARVKDMINDRNGKNDEFTIRARGIINATGPFSDEIRKLDDPDTKEIVAPSLGVHVVLPGYFSPANMGLLDPSTSDGRVIFFLPWQGNTIAGTTDAPTKISQNPIAGEKDIEWILSEIRGYLAPDINIRRGDILAAWSGIRPLVRDPDAKNTESLVRNHLITVSPSGLLTCAGGKWTTYRQMAEEAVDRAVSIFNIKPSKVSYVPDISGLGHNDAAILDGQCQTHRVRLVGAHGYSKTLFINLVQHFGIETDIAKHLAESYGDRAWQVCALSSPSPIPNRFPARGRRISDLYPFIDGEVRHAVRHEYAQTAVDVLGRRTRLSFLNAQAALEALPIVIDLMAEELRWDAARKEVEWKRTTQYLASMGLPQSKLDVTREEVESRRAEILNDKLYSRHGEFLNQSKDLSSANRHRSPRRDASRGFISSSQPKPYASSWFTSK
jgi:glycerol-3-phosphate dehydrogenase